MEFDARLTNLGVQANQTANAIWDLTAAKYQDVAEAGGTHHIYFTVRDAANKPLSNVACVVDWVGREPGDPPTKVVTDANGQANVPIYANLDIHLLNGPYFAFVEDQTKSDVVTGMGLPEKHHVNFLLTFARQTSSTSTSLEQTVLTEAKKRTWMPINDQAALYKFAQQNHLGYPQTDEYEFTCNNEGYLGQVFNLGIVYVKKGNWGNVKWVKKPS